MQNQKITIGLGDTLKFKTAEIIRNAGRAYRFLTYADIRINIGDGLGGSAENGMPKSSSRDYSLEFSIRVIAGHSMNAAGYYGVSLGPTDLPNFFTMVQEAIVKSYTRALYSAAQKSKRKTKWGKLGESLWDMQLASVPAYEKTIPAEYRVYPLDVPLHTIIETASAVSKEVSASDPNLKYNFCGIATWMEREIFASSQGALIDQTFAYTQGTTFVVAQKNGVTQEHYDYLAHQRGWEIIENGVQEAYIQFPSYREFSLRLGKEASELAGCPSCPWSEKPVVVVTDPHYNTLKVHEIVGHPTEADRILKMEASYARRSWLYGDTKKNYVGKQIGSPLLNAYSDPLLPGYGHYTYDHEGTPARRVWHIRNGVLEGFMNSRQTSAILGDEPNGHWKANGGQVVPLVRMSVTVFAQGDRNPKDIIGEVNDGYYLVGHRIPSIAESRENFRISARKVYKIEKGELTTLYRDGGIMADVPDYFRDIDAVGNDFRLYPIPNCGKGQPMQVKKLGNGGPTMRSRAILVGGAKQ